jgi:phage/conjugal plasmid C-4 type zinc finger TraR family protein
MAGGWSKDGAVQEQIDDSINDAIELARSQLPEGESLTECEECETEIPEGRRQAVPGVRLCVNCQQLLDEEANGASQFNRKGSKGSQLR